jgi:alkanesulfonate monooxygenase SsuD/methylene tetrahydromethanopterin reductase-like flavin-dependent oxidoreductase (luciferase family)
MKFGLFDIVQYPAGEAPADYDPKITAKLYSDRLDIWTEADELGFDYIFLGEHHFSSFGLCPDPYLLLAALARQTQRIRLGAMVSVLPYHQPYRLAEQLAMVDLLSNGRLDVGFGRGQSVPEFAGFHLDMEQAWPAFQEGVELILRAWSEPEVAFEGRYTRVGPVTLWPRPLQQPRPPVWVTATSPATLEWVAKHGFNIATGQGSPEQIGERFNRFRQIAAEAGHTLPANHSIISRIVFVAETDEKAQELVEPGVRQFQERFLRYVLAKPGQQVPESLREHYEVYDRALRERRTPNFQDLLGTTAVIAGTPDTVLGTLRRLEEATGVGTVLCGLNFGNTLSSEQILASLRLMAKEVLPALQPAPSAGR